MQDQTNHPVVQKLWGTEEWVTNNELYCMKILRIKPGFWCSYHYHPIKDETFLVRRGTVAMVVDGQEIVLRPGESIRLKPGTPHKFRACFYMTAEVIEASTQHSDEDVVRLEESRAVYETV